MSMPAARTTDRLREAAPVISVGLVTADLSRLGSEILILEEAGVPSVHFDVMDGCFCPPLSFGPPIIKAVKTSLLKDVHLMIDNPLNKLEEYVAAGADMITVHYESTPHPHRVLQVLGRLANSNDVGRGLARGLALNPGTPVNVIEPLLDEVDLVCLLAVNPGWGGQAFIPSTARRLEQARQIAEAAGKDTLFAVDGGVTRDNIAAVASMGADMIVTGSAVFDGKAAPDNARVMLARVAEARARRNQ